MRLPESPPPRPKKPLLARGEVTLAAGGLRSRARDHAVALPTERDRDLSPCVGGVSDRVLGGVSGGVSDRVSPWLAWAGFLTGC